MIYDVSQPLFWYRPVFMMQLIVAEAMFSARLSLRGRAWARIPAALCVCLAAAFAFPLPVGLSQTPWYCAMMFLALFCVSTGGLAFVCRTSFKNAVMIAIAGYTVQHIASELYELLNVLMGLNGKLISNVYETENATVGGTDVFAGILYCWTYLVTYWGAYMLFASPMERGVFDMKKSHIVVITAVIVLIDVIFSSFVTYGVPVDAYRLLVVIAHCYNVLCCVIALFLLFELPKRITAEAELSVERHLRHLEETQYLTAKENIDLINLKCHDLKHQIRRLTDGSNAKEVAGEIENLIEVYDAALKTENEALDIVLTEKSLLCREQSVKLSCIADGKKLEFMKDTDIYAFFGNMLDNAIEAVSKLPEDRRTIGISVTGVNSFVVVNVRNNYEGEIRMENGLPLTDKSDRDYHGFGMKSIRWVVEKYGGEMAINVGGNIFNLNAVFPL